MTTIRFNKFLCALVKQKVLSRELSFLLRQRSIMTSFPEVVMYVRFRWQQWAVHQVHGA